MRQCFLLLCVGTYNTQYNGISGWYSFDIRCHFVQESKQSQKRKSRAQIRIFAKRIQTIRLLLGIRKNDAKDAHNIRN